jgi:hypothetical protein
MKTTLFAYTLLVVVTAAGTTAQSLDSTSSSRVRSMDFFRIYPLEVFTNEFRLGVEIGVAPQQSLLVDGSYFGKRDFFTNGRALKLDYRFYTSPVSSNFRFFYGPNIMVKYQDGYKGLLFNNRNKIISSRYITGLSMKVGADLRLSKSGRTRIEFFTGVGIRYKSKVLKTILDLKNWGGELSQKGALDPNLLGGVMVKF